MANLRADNLCGTGFISANNGTVWSDYVASTTGSTLTNYPATYGFDGNLSNFVYADNNSTMTWTAPNGGIKAERIEVYVYAGNTHPPVRVNGVNTGGVVGSATPNQLGNWVDVTDLVDGHLKTIEAYGYPISSTARSSGWAAVRINDEILVDGERGGRSGGREANDGSLFFNSGNSGGNNYLKIASNSDFAYGTGDFTWEAWVNLAHGSNRGYIIDHGSDGGSLTYTDSSPAKILYYNSTTGAGGALYNNGGSLSTNCWNHIAVARNSGTTKLFVNGVEKASQSDGHNYSAQAVTIGMYGALTGDTNWWDGYISNLRIVKGTALYTASFTPPTEKLTAIDGTVLLCCQDSDDATQEATGKTITGYGRYFAATGEKFANTGFTADSDWTKGAGWTISGGVATHAQGSAGDLAQQISGLVVGQTYKLSVDILTTDNDVAYFFVDNNPGGNYPPLTGASNSPVGHHFIYFDANATTMWLGFRGSSLWAGTLTNLRLSSADHGKASKVLPPVGVDPGVIFDGYTKINSQGVLYFPTGDTSQRGRGRGVVFAGETPSGPASPRSRYISFVEMQSGGIAMDFGNLTKDCGENKAVGSSTRGVVQLSGDNPATILTLEYITFATTSNSIDFGDLNQAWWMRATGGNETRGLFAGGLYPGSTFKLEVDYITIASAGDALDFGDLQTA